MSIYSKILTQNCQMILLQNGKKPTINDYFKIKDSKNSKNLLKKINQSSEEKRSYKTLIDKLTFIEKCIIVFIC